MIDVDNVNLDSLTVTITNQLDGTAETLAGDVTGATSITASLRLWYRYLEPNRLQTPWPIIKQVLRTITYNNAAQDPDTTDRIVTFIANDGTDDSNVAHHDRDDHGDQRPGGHGSGC